MKKLFLTAAFLGLSVSLILPGCDSVTCYPVGGSITTESVGVHEFKRIELYTEADVIVTQTDTNYAELVANDDMSRIVQYHFDLADSTFQIDVTEDCFDGVDQFQVNCYMEDINGFDNNGSGHIHLTGPVDNGDIILNLTGSGGITIDDMRTTGVNATLTGSGNLRASGPDTCYASNIQVNGSGSVLSFGMKARNSNVVVGGSGNVEIYVTDTLTGSITGSGNISYIGTPFIDVTVLGSGQLIDAN